MSLAVQAQNFTLAGSGVTNTANSIVLKSFKLPDGTTNIVMANFGPTGYGTLEPGTTKEESIKFTGVTQNGNGTATLTGVTRGLDFVSPYAETTANKFSHAGGAIFIISNTSAYESELVDAANPQTIGGIKTFTSIPVLPASDPTTDNQATRKKYVDDGLALKMALAGTETVTGQKTFPSADATRARVASDTDTTVAEAFVTLGQLSRQAIAGAANASTTVKGLVEEATDAEVIASTVTGATGARLYVTPAQLNTFGVPTGTIAPYAGSSAPSNWLICNGAAVSRTTYANLFTILSTTYGIGDNSTTFNLPDLRARTPIGIGAVTKVATFASRSSNVITVTGLTNEANNEFQTGQAVLYTATSGAMTGLTHNTTYYLVRTGNLTFSLATSLANAQNGTVITLSSDGTGTQTFTLTLTTRTLGATGGEENHAMSSTELLSHKHTILGDVGTVIGVYSASTNATGRPQDTNTTGGNAAMNNMQPFLGVNYIIKI